jgi:lipoyl(octanoyl) transferase
MDYMKAWELQQAQVRERSEDRAADTLLIVEHPATYTLGRRGDECHLLTSRRVLESMNIGVHRVDRGGDITFHGPGQLVGYPILGLEARAGGVTRYVRDLEEMLIQAVAAFGVRAQRLEGFTGVWVENEKIAAIGVKVNARRVTSHGFALNAATDLSYFERIVPCGIRDKGVTSLSRILGREVALKDVANEVVAAFGRVFGVNMVEHRHV